MELEKAVERGKALIGRVILYRDSALVPSSRGGYMTVQFISHYTLRCPCPSYKFPRVKINDHPICKHVIAALYLRWLLAGAVGSFEDELSRLTLAPMTEIQFGG